MTERDVSSAGLLECRTLASFSVPATGRLVWRRCVCCSLVDINLSKGRGCKNRESDIKGLDSWPCARRENCGCACAEHRRGSATEDAITRCLSQTFSSSCSQLCFTVGLEGEGIHRVYSVLIHQVRRSLHVKTESVLVYSSLFYQINESDTESDFCFFALVILFCWFIILW